MAFRGARLGLTLHTGRLAIGAFFQKSRRRKTALDVGIRSAARVPLFVFWRYRSR